MLLILLIGTLLLQAWAWRRFSARVRSGGLSKGQAIARYAGWAMVPAAACAAIFFFLVGLEEWSGAALVSEPMGRATPLMALVLVVQFFGGSFAFAVWCALLGASVGAEQKS